MGRPRSATRIRICLSRARRCVPLARLARAFWASLARHYIALLNERSRNALPTSPNRAPLSAARRRPNLTRTPSRSWPRCGRVWPNATPHVADFGTTLMENPANSDTETTTRGPISAHFGPESAALARPDLARRLKSTNGCQESKSAQKRPSLTRIRPMSAKVGPNTRPNSPERGRESARILQHVHRLRPPRPFTHACPWCARRPPRPPTSRRPAPTTATATTTTRPRTCPRW